MKISDAYTPVRYQYRMMYPISGLVHGIRINLLDDLDEFFSKKLDEQGIERKKAKDKKSENVENDRNDPTMDYCRIQRRLLEIRPRKVLKAKTFRCPKEYKNRLQFFENAVTNGANLNPFLSKGVKKLWDEDLLLNDWNIYHFHLGDKKEAQSCFMERSDFLLFAYVTNEAVCFIDIVPHGEKNKAHLWANKRYVQVIRDNWPELIEKYRWGNKTLSAQFNENEYYRLRRGGITAGTDLDDGSSYLLIGGGYASNGVSNRAVYQADHLRKRTGELEEKVTIVFWQLAQQMPDVKNKIKNNVPPHLKLTGTAKGLFTLIEPTLQVLILAECDEHKYCWHFKMLKTHISYFAFKFCRIF